MEVIIKRMEVLHVWFHDNANKLIRMWVSLLKSLGDVIFNTLNVGITQCTLLIFVNHKQVNYKACVGDYLNFDYYM
jgi:hypothetical protein